MICKYKSKRFFSTLIFFLVIFVYFNAAKSDVQIKQDTTKDSLRQLLNQWKIKLFLRARARGSRCLGLRVGVWIELSWGAGE